MKRILYISYDGMTDPLGQSQVIPYLVGLSKSGYQFTILSFEKKEPFSRLADQIRSLLTENGIQWVPMRFSTRPPVVSKLYDAIRMKKMAIRLQRKVGFDMTHCRSYLGANIGLILKKKFGVRFFFDMRGFWADEKKDGGAWPQTSWLFRNVYKYFKRKEAAYLQHADYIISLTEAGRKEMTSWPSFNERVPLSVIPCCADMDHFTLTSEMQKAEGRKILGLPEDKLVLSYLGSLGSWYMLDEMLSFFALLQQKYPGAIFLIITHSDPQLIRSKLAAYKIGQEAVHIVKAERREVPVYAKAANITVSFIKPVYSKLSSSPTKVGELLVMGIPVIANAGVGDMESVINRTNGGYVISNFGEEDFLKAIDAIPGMLKSDPAAIREKAADIFSLSNGVLLYRDCYQKVFNEQKKGL